MEVSGEFSRVVDFLGKLAGCSVLFLGVAFCAGYFFSSTYLKAFDSEWFLSGFTFVELVIRGVWNAVYGSIGLVTLLVIAQSPSVSERNLMWLMRIVCYPFYLFVVASSVYYKFGSDWIGVLSQNPWARGWLMATLVCQAANYLHPESLQHVVFKVFSIFTLFLLAYWVVVEMPKVSAREYADELQGESGKGMLKVYKFGSKEVYRLVDSANGKLLLQGDDKSLLVVDPANDWRISR